jgi:hypothetical protein
MGKSSEKFMQMREQEGVGLEHIDDEYTYKEWINNLRSPRVIGIGVDSEGFLCLISGDTPREVFELAKMHEITDKLHVTVPQRYIFNK